MSLANVKYTPNYATGLRFITSTTFSGASSVSIDGCFSSAYQHYLVMRNYSGSVDNEWSYVQLRTSGVSAATNYRRQRMTASSTAVDSGRGTSETYFSQAMGYQFSTLYGFSRLWISNPFEAVRTTAWFDFGFAMDGNIGLQSVVCAHDDATSYDGFRVVPNTGTITGSIYVYGLREAR